MSESELNIKFIEDHILSILCQEGPKSQNELLKYMWIDNLNILFRVQRALDTLLEQGKVETRNGKLVPIRLTYVETI